MPRKAKANFMTDYSGLTRAALNKNEKGSQKFCGKVTTEYLKVVQQIISLPLLVFVWAASVFKLELSIFSP